MTSTEAFDVAIIGSGLGGSILATTLAARGVRTVLIEAGTHPRFAIGESLVPETSLRLKLLGERFGVPEIGYLGSFHKLRDHVSPACGVKRSFAFAYHRPGQEQRGEESNELPTLTPPFGPDAHLLRQDTDLWMLTVASRYGVDVRQRTMVEDLAIDNRGATLQLGGGRTIQAEFVVDATGQRGIVGRKLGLRDPEPRFATNSRALFTHMTGVVPYDAVGPSKHEHGMPVPFSQSTLHHVFDGGWIWVIPFDNHRRSTMPLCSIGLVLDRRKWGDAEQSAEAEFRALVETFPSIARQFEHARAVRPWVATGRLQYSSSTTIGDRFCLLPHAAGFIDPLYSSGLSLTVGCIDLLSSRLAAAVRDRAFKKAQLEVVDELVQSGLAHYDMIVSRSFDSWRHYETWNAWNRVWALGNYLGTWGPLRLLVKWKQTGDRDYLDALGRGDQSGLLASQHPEFVAVRDDAAAWLDEALDDRLTPDDAAQRIFARIGELDFIPGHIRFSDRDGGRAPTVFTMLTGARHVAWYQYRAPTKWRDYCAFPLRTYARLVCGHVWSAFSSSCGVFWRAVRDVLWAGNQDWARPALPFRSNSNDTDSSSNEQRDSRRPYSVTEVYRGGE